MADWTIPAKSFDATVLAAYTGTLQDGATINLDEVMTEHACQAIVTTGASGDEAAIHLEGSLDGTNWYTLATAGIPAGGASGAGTTSGLLTVSGQAALFVRTTGYGADTTVTTLHTSGKV